MYEYVYVCVCKYCIMISLRNHWFFEAVIPNDSGRY